jgi:hypothetical protein
MLANGPVAAVLRASARQKLSAGLLGSVLIYCLTREKNGGFDEATGLGRAWPLARYPVAKSTTDSRSLPMRAQATTNGERIRSRR